MKIGPSLSGEQDAAPFRPALSSDGFVIAGLEFETRRRCAPLETKRMDASSRQMASAARV
jgi:hypothetical protein